MKYAKGELQSRCKKSVSLGFTMLELIFVIVVVGIISKLGAEIFRNTYDAYLLSAIQNKMQVNTETAIQQIANRLQYRLKNSIIERRPDNTFRALPSAVGDGRILEWVGYDIDGWRGNWNGTFNAPAWSGFVDVDLNDTTFLSSPGTNLATANANILNLVPTVGTTINNAAIFFTGEQSDIQNQYGWNGAAQNEQNNTAAHLIFNNGVAGQIAPGVDNFAGVEVYEQYKLAWTAYALELNTTGGLWLHYDYQPWEGESVANGDGARALLLENVTTFKFASVGDLVKVQLCVDNNSSIGDYSVCKEKAIF